jgi:restriction system protein
MTKNAWMIRAGEGGYLIDEFAKGVVTVGWPEVGEVTDKSQRDLWLRVGAVFPDSKPGTNQNAASVLWRFAKVLKVGDAVVSYDPPKREYLIGEIASDYRYEKKRGDHPHARDVTWHQRVSRDQLSVPTRNSLGSTLTLFAISDDAAVELLSAAKSKRPENAPGGLEERKDQLLQSNRDAEEQAKGLIEDKILALDPYQMQELIAAVLRAMSYRTRVSPPGADRGVDVLASPDGLGLQEPRIKVEVKHRPKTAIGSNEVRSFLGGLRSGDRGLYVSTGSFSKEAKYEAERGTIPVTLIDLRELAQLVTDNYENFDTKGRALLPLVRIYRPAD